MSECVLFEGSLNHAGYGRKWDPVQKRVRPAHVLAWEAVHGPVPDGYELDHVKARGCVSRACILVAHLEPVTHAENQKRRRKPAEHGTYAGYRQHQNRGTTPCSPCLEAKAAYGREWRAA